MVLAPAGTHFVGSICLDTAEDVFTILSAELGSRSKRIPDGETGNRYNWVDWQIQTFSHVKRLQRTLDSGVDHATEPSIPDDEAKKMIGELHTGYADMALKSYAIFAKLKNAGTIPKHVKFQVSMPTPVAGTQRGVAPQYAHVAEPAYEAALYRDLRQLQDNIPHSELSIQWDVAAEIMVMEGAYARIQELHGLHAEFGYQGPWWDDIKAGSLERLVKIGSRGHIDADVDMGYHLCYGDFGHKHFIEPVDASLLAEIANELLTKVDRTVNFIHMPVPKQFQDETYYLPLQKVAGLFKEKDTTLFLGLVHWNDLDGTKARVASADKVLGSDISWGVATECGIGRTPKEHLAGILEITREVSSPIV